MRFKVPQNIDMQDKILGPLTMVQFAYVTIGLGFCYIIYMSLVKFLPQGIILMIIAPLALFTFAVGFLKVNERPFLNFFLYFLNYLSGPKQRIWHPVADSDLKVEVYKPVVKVAPVVQAKEISRSEIEKYTHQVDSSDNNETLIRR